MTVFLSVAVALFSGLMLTRVFKKLGFNFPDVTAYLIAGLIIGPYGLGRLGIEGLGFISSESVEAVSMISTAALGFIAFSIGSEFRLSSLKHTGRAAVVIGIFQALAATLLVDGALVVLHFIMGEEILPMPVVLTLGAIASATAPAATLMVVRQYKAHGPLTSLLLPIVALDDAVGLVLFAVSFGIAKALSAGAVDLISIVVDPLIEILGSLLLGTLAGIALTELEKLFHSNTNRLAMTIGFVFVTVALSMLRIPVGPVKISFSSLLVCMMMGSVFCNLCPLSEEIMSRADKWSAPLMVLFFVISGAELELGVFAKGSAVLIGLIYILTRSAGKYFGARESARLVHCSDNVIRYLGITLLPQAGVALGMCVTAAKLPGDGPMIRNIVLFAVLIYELVGPLLTKWALTKAGDIQPRSQEVLTRRARKLAEAAAKNR